jgi:ribosomal protein S18 acetylase RimI-like enzyme
MPFPIATPRGVLSLRRFTPDDLPFLARLYATTREDELAQVPWTDEQKAEFCRQQFEAQHAWWQEHYTNARYDLVLLNGRPAGRLYVDVWKDEVRIIDIALLPEHRGAGLGAALLRAVLTEGDGRGLPVSIHVERFNPALRLYHRLGFEMVEDKGVYLLLRRPVGGAVEAAA